MHSRRPTPRSLPGSPRLCAAGKVAAAAGAFPCLLLLTERVPGVSFVPSAMALLVAMAVGSGEYRVQPRPSFKPTPTRKAMLCFPGVMLSDPLNGADRGHR